jgi:hypothetical protein
MAKTLSAHKGMPQQLRSGVPDGQPHAFLRYVNPLSTRHIGEYSMLELRRRWRLITLALGRRESVAVVRELEIPGPGVTLLLGVIS